MKRFLATGFLACTILVYGYAQNNVGIGTTIPHPSALLHVDVGNNATKGLMVTGDSSSFSTVPNLGSGVRMMFYPGRGALRAGLAINDSWDNNNVGYRSTAFGVGPTASGYASVAMGQRTFAMGAHSTTMGLETIATGTAATATGSNTEATGASSTAMGYLSKATGNYSFATGEYSLAAGISSVAMGIETQAVGYGATATGAYTQANAYGSIAMGFYAKANGMSSLAAGDFASANGEVSVAIGREVLATGNYAVAMGREVTASGNNSFAAGRRISTNGNTGAFFFGDSDPHGKGVTNSGFPNQVAMRFNGGYYFISSNAGANDIGVQVTAGGNSWSAISDARLKENFLPVDGEDVLRKISKLSLPTWNYKGQDSKTFRHYGPMAHEFFAAFGKDDLGTIGCDTLINQHDFLGVNLIAIQALERRTGELQKENDALKEQNQKLEARLEKLERLINKN